MFKKFTALLLVLTMAGTLISCTKKNDNTSKDVNDKLIWYIMFQEQKDLELVETEINKIVKEKIGMEVDIRRIDPGSYSEKMRVMFGANDQFDLCWMGGSQYQTYASQGALLDLDDLLKKYAPVSYNQVPQEFWNATTVGGKIYGFINYQIVARQYGYVIQQEVLDKYNMKIGDINKFEDIEPLLIKIKDNNAEDIPTAIFGGGPYSLLLGDYGMESIKDFCGIRTDNDDLKVINIYEEPEFLEFCKLMRSWYEKDLISKDAASITNGMELRKKGIVKTWWDMIGPGFEPSFQESCGGNAVATNVIIPPTVTSDNIKATMTSISKTTKHPKEAMQLLELVNTNEGNIYNMLCFGLEGKHYKKVSENRIEQITDSGYSPNISWAWGNQFNAYLLPGQPDDLWAKTKQLNDTAEKSKLLGFNLDIEPINVELSQISAVKNEFFPILTTGTIAPEETYKKFIDKMKVAGTQKVIDEVQRQVDAWKNK